MSTLFDTGTRCGAAFSPCRTWRYALWRIWDADLPRCAFIGLNPSTADEKADDPTIRKCIGFATRWGFGGVKMLNLYAFRATDPAEMIAARDPVGPGNCPEEFTRDVDCIVAAWGSLRMAWRSRVNWESVIAETCERIGKPLDCLRLTKDGSPWHPLYVPYEIERQRFWTPTAAKPQE